MGNCMVPLFGWSAIIVPTGWRMVNGISDSYHTAFPPELYDRVPIMMHFYTISRINDYLKDNLTDDIECRCTDLGDSCPRLMKTNQIYKDLENMLVEENRTNYKHYNIFWSLQKRRNTVSRRLELVIQIAFKL